VNGTYGSTTAAVLLNVTHVANNRGSHFQKKKYKLYRYTKAGTFQTPLGKRVVNFRDPKAKEFRFHVFVVSLML
jgi:hypothetical protein